MDGETVAAFSPEAMSLLRARYRRAIAKVYGAAGPETPGPECLFDTVIGIRLIISREAATDGGMIIHVSASPLPGTDAGRGVDEMIRAYGEEYAKTFFAGVAECLFREVSGDPRPMVFCGFHDPLGYPEWLIRD